MKTYLIAVLLLLSTGVFAQTVTAVVEDKTKKIEVTGSAEMEVVPDEIFVNFTLQEYYDKQKKKIDIDQIQRDFLDKCTKANIAKDRIMVQNMSGFDQNNWYWRRRKKEQPDLLASTTYIIKFSSPADIDKLVNTLDDNSTTQMNINHVSHSKMEDFRKDIKIKALQAAKAKAQYLCGSIGETLGGTLYIQEIDNNYSAQPMYMPMMANKAMDAQSANEGIDFQKMKIRYEMRASFEIK